ncbi:MAG TPA: hypothetical protein DCP61_00850 [Treponema sp.]|nr:hypothetical protein [Treponema sp.]
MYEDEAMDLCVDNVETYKALDSAATWRFFWDGQESLSDEEFDLLKDLCYKNSNTKDEHDLLTKIVNRELTLRIKNKRELEASALAS